MLKSPLLFAISILVTLVSWTGVAEATEDRLALSFALPPVETVIAQKPITEATTLENTAIKRVASKDSVSSNKNTSGLEALSRPQEPLRSITEHSTSSISHGSGQELSDSIKTDTRPQVNPTKSSQKVDSDIGIQFLKDTVEIPQQQETADKENIEQTGPNERISNSNSTGNLELDDWIFEGGSHSLVAHTVGSAEGTRHWSGKRTKAYYGHTDPGNGVWNLGTFSYQHAASSPEDADDKQLKRLKRQGVQLKQKASQQGLQLSLKEKLNGLDLANQAPLAALGEGGYVERLAQAYRLQLEGEEAIAWARVRAYIDPDTKTWNAPGLGNNLYSISKDQERRMAAIDKALRAYEQLEDTGIALASLDTIHLEGSELDGAGLGRARRQGTSFGSVAEAFKLAAHDISAEELPIDKENLASVAMSFDLPTSASIEQGNNMLSTESTRPDSSAPVSSSLESNALESDALEGNHPEIDDLEATVLAPADENQAIEEATEDIRHEDLNREVLTSAHHRDRATPVVESSQNAIALTFSSPATLSTNDYQTTATEDNSLTDITTESTNSELTLGSLEAPKTEVTATNETVTPQTTLTPREVLDPISVSALTEIASIEGAELNADNNINTSNQQPTLGSLLSGILSRKTAADLAPLTSSDSDIENTKEQSSQQSFLHIEDSVGHQP